MPRLSGRLPPDSCCLPPEAIRFLCQNEASYFQPRPIPVAPLPFSETFSGLGNAICSFKPITGKECPWQRCKPKCSSNRSGPLNCPPSIFPRARLRSSIRRGALLRELVCEYQEPSALEANEGFHQLISLKVTPSSAPRPSTVIDISKGVESGCATTERAAYQNCAARTDCERETRIGSTYAFEGESRLASHYP